MLVTELCREHGMSNASFYKWLSKYGGYYSIHAAASFGHADIVNLFLPNNLDVNIINKTNGVIPLFMAMEKKHNELVKSLLNQDGVDLTIVDILGQDALCWGVETRDLEIMKILIEKN